MKWIMNISDPNGKTWYISEIHGDAIFSRQVDTMHPAARAEIAQLTAGRILGKPLVPPDSPHTAEELIAFGLVGLYELEPTE